MSDITVKNNKFVSAVIVSAGNSTRMGGINKQFLEINNIPVIVYTIRAFDESDLIDEIVIVTRESDIESVGFLVKKHNIKKVSKIVCGGETRQLSVYNGVVNTSENTDFVAIHDGARPLVTDKVIADTITTAFEYNSAATGVKVKDTVKQVNDNNDIVATPDRTYLRFIQTPQVFNKSLYLNAVNTVENSRDFTDDCMLIEAYGEKVKFVDGDYENIKITTPEDVELALNYLNKRRDKDA
ncbi:MAG: 2-C-methyl-D-erythritol 4-phosphate cytidylyltransferase [Clostridia bacterium]|nr:2-C-methyl-D-erythritol 4-phosphate cytidylyltransferase [Clostridia bacterium]